MNRRSAFGVDATTSRPHGPISTLTFALSLRSDSARSAVDLAPLPRRLGRRVGRDGDPTVRQGQVHRLRCASRRHLDLQLCALRHRQHHRAEVETLLEHVGQPVGDVVVVVRAALGMRIDLVVGVLEHRFPRGRFPRGRRRPRRVSSTASCSACLRFLRPNTTARPLSRPGLRGRRWSRNRRHRGSVSSSAGTSTKSTSSTRCTSSCAIRSPRRTSIGVRRSWLIRHTLISPRYPASTVPGVFTTDRAGFRGQPGAGMDQADGPDRQCDRDTGADEGALTRVDDQILCAAQIHARIAGMRPAREGNVRIEAQQWHSGGHPRRCAHVRPTLRRTTTFSSARGMTDRIAPGRGGRTDRRCPAHHLRRTAVGAAVVVADRIRADRPARRRDPHGCAWHPRVAAVRVAAARPGLGAVVAVAAPGRGGAAQRREPSCSSVAPTCPPTSSRGPPRCRPARRALLSAGSWIRRRTCNIGPGCGPWCCWCSTIRTTRRRTGWSVRVARIGCSPRSVSALGR